MTQMLLTECPRDAMQGMADFIPTSAKIEYINSLIRVGFPVIDVGSFVSPKAIPQMRDTEDVLSALKINERVKLLAIVANERGARQAVEFPEITYLGYPFSISQTFQRRNTNATIEESFDRVKAIQEIAQKAGKRLRIYISMGFGNPYGDPWEPPIVSEWMGKLAVEGVEHFALADTVGQADVPVIEALFTDVLSQFNKLEVGAHFHAKPEMASAKIKAAWESGCRHFDSALLGIGGCPMAQDDLVGNIATEALLAFANENHLETHLHMDALPDSLRLASEIFH